MTSSTSSSSSSSAHSTSSQPLLTSSTEVTIEEKKERGLIPVSDIMSKTDNLINFFIQPSLQSQLFTPILGKIFEARRTRTIENEICFKSRFVLQSEKTNEKMSKALAYKCFWKAYKTVPAYKTFIKNFCAEKETSKKNFKKFKDIPSTSKKNYIQQFLLAETLVDGKLPKKGKIDTSTGTTGEPTKWVRGIKEQKAIRSMIHNVVKVVMGNEPFIFINGFVLGPWATGLNAAAALAADSLLFSTGPDIEKILNFITAFKHEKRPFVVASYPPFLKKLVDTAREKNVNLSECHLIGIVGGEAISENLRDRIIEGGFNTVLSSYGASDLDINIGYESPFEIALRKELEKNPELAVRLYGPTAMCP